MHLVEYDYDEPKPAKVSLAPIIIITVVIITTIINSGTIITNVVQRGCYRLSSDGLRRGRVTNTLPY